jgi:GDPmannose 4,6-dehydratase
MKIALVTGASGQDGHYMVEHLQSTNQYQHVYGLVRGFCDLTTDFFDEVLSDYKPDEIYNFAGNSDNARAFDDPYGLLNANTIPVIKILEYLKKSDKNPRFFQASSSLIFGENHEGGFQRLTTRMNPTTPYGASKLYSYNLIETYKKHYGVFAVNGILFNHESTRRKPHFVLPKIVKGLIEFKKSGKTFELGNIEAERDWTHAKDIVRGAYLSLQKDKPDNWIFARGNIRSIKDALEYISDKINVNWTEAIKTNPCFLNKRQENNYPGDIENTKEKLKWISEYSFEHILDELIQQYEELLSS